MANVSQVAYVIIKSRFFPTKQTKEDVNGVEPIVIKFLYSGNHSLHITDDLILIKKLVGGSFLEVLRIPYDKKTESLEVTTKSPKYKLFCSYDVSTNLGDLDTSNFKAPTLSLNTPTIGTIAPNGTGRWNTTGDGTITFINTSSNTEQLNS